LEVAEMTREHDTRIWRVLEHHVGAARDREDFSAVTKVGMDETSTRKGGDYVSIVADMMRGGCASPPRAQAPTRWLASPLTWPPTAATRRASPTPAPT
jgi:hypothetical protein